MSGSSEHPRPAAAARPGDGPSGRWSDATSTGRGATITASPFDAGGWHLNVDPYPVPHGTPAGFSTYGCRCPGCCEAWDRTVGRHHVPEQTAGKHSTAMEDDMMKSFLANQSREFLAGQNTDDREELLYRARRHAAHQTCTWPKEASDIVVEAFVNRVDEMIPRIRRQASRPVTHFEDFEDHQMFN